MVNWILIREHYEFNVWKSIFSSCLSLPLPGLFLIDVREWVWPPYVWASSSPRPPSSLRPVSSDTRLKHFAVGQRPVCPWTRTRRRIHYIISHELRYSRTLTTNYYCLFVCFIFIPSASGWPFDQTNIVNKSLWFGWVAPRQRTHANTRRRIRFLLLHALTDTAYTLLLTWPWWWAFLCPWILFNHFRLCFRGGNGRHAKESVYNDSHLWIKTGGWR